MKWEMAVNIISNSVRFCAPIAAPRVHFCFIMSPLGRWRRRDAEVHTESPQSLVDYIEWRQDQSRHAKAHMKPR